jgi:hypothetical protein
MRAVTPLRQWLVWHLPTDVAKATWFILYVYDCAANTHVWTYTYTIDIPDFTLPADGCSTVNCARDAMPPTPPVMQDACGNTITPVLVWHHPH